MSFYNWWVSENNSQASKVINNLSSTVFSTIDVSLDVSKTRTFEKYQFFNEILKF